MRNAIKFLKYTRINNNIIKLKKIKQLFFSPIHSLKPIELETFKTYIKTNLNNNFIYFFKSFIRISTFFDKKSDKSLCFYINYQSQNNFIIKNKYLFLLIRKSFD